MLSIIFCHITSCCQKLTSTRDGHEHYSSYGLLMISLRPRPINFPLVIMIDYNRLILFASTKINLFDRSCWIDQYSEQQERPVASVNIQERKLQLYFWLKQLYINTSYLDIPMPWSVGRPKLSPSDKRKLFMMFRNNHHHEPPRAKFAMNWKLLEYQCRYPLVNQVLH